MSVRRELDRNPELLGDGQAAAGRGVGAATLPAGPLGDDEVLEQRAEEALEVFQALRIAGRTGRFCGSRAEAARRRSV